MNSGAISSNNHHQVSEDAIPFTLVMVVFFLMFLWASLLIRLHLIVFHVLSGQQQPSATAAAEHSLEFANREQGLDEAIIHSYPKIIYSQVPKSDSVPSSCSICLVDFAADDVIRMLPYCLHLYHVNCIESWLKLYPTCPICRSIPDRASVPSVQAEMDR